MAKIGRNEPCACGSGKKYKTCCEAKAQANSGARLMIVLIAALVLAGVLAMMANRGQSTGGGVWSAEHGHYHDASGREIGR